MTTGTQDEYLFLEEYLPCVPLEIKGWGPFCKKMKKIGKKTGKVHTTFDILVYVQYFQLTFWDSCRFSIPILWMSFVLSS